MYIPEIKFGHILYCEDEGGATVYYISNAERDDYYQYLDTLIFAGYTRSCEYSLGQSLVSIMKKESDMVMCCYYESISEMRIVAEPTSLYFDFSDKPGERKCDALMTQIDLEDYGESVVFRLTDGRFIIYDGGWPFTPDAQKLVNCLREQSPDKVPTVACWIFTHPHIDHYRCFLEVFEKFPGAFTVERFIYNFPNTEDKDIARIPRLIDEVEHLAKLEDYVKKTGAEVYKAHTGQVYEIGGAKLEILSSPDDTFFVPVNNINVLSLVIKMTVEGQIFMMCGDSTLGVARLGERFGKYLKSDVLQPTHHMFSGGDIKTYDYIDPRVCVVSGFERHVFGTFSPVSPSSRECSNHLFYNMNVEEFFTGGTGNVVLPIPYQPSPNGKRNYLSKLEEYSKRIGAKSWFFSDLTPKECEFIITNTTHGTAKISVDLLTDDGDGYVEAIRFDAPALRVIRVNVLDTEIVDGDALYYNPCSLAKKGVKADARYTVHLTSDVPIVIKGKCSPDYYA